MNQPGLVLLHEYALLSYPGQMMTTTATAADL